eukprot:5868688-Pleurochrysis_carterae.AAC.2
MRTGASNHARLQTSPFSPLSPSPPQLAPRRTRTSLLPQAQIHFSFRSASTLSNSFSPPLALAQEWLRTQQQGAAGTPLPFFLTEVAGPLPITRLAHALSTSAKDSTCAAPRADLTPPSTSDDSCPLLADSMVALWTDPPL